MGPGKWTAGIGISRVLFTGLSRTGPAPQCPFFYSTCYFFIGVSVRYYVVSVCRRTK